jgi:hypothetical protein
VTSGITIASNAVENTVNTEDRPDAMQSAGDSQTVLRAGPLTLEYQCGALGRVLWNGRLILLSVYGAVRDRDWVAVPARITEVDRLVEPESFRVVFDAVHVHNDVHFAWRGLIVGSAEGSITFDFDGGARTAFLRNRIGLCLLHPAECAGASCRVEHVDGTASEAALPDLPAPRQPVPPFTNMRAMSHVFGDLGRVYFRFEGEAFELEDHRNWTDASFKTFSTPIDLPAPVTIPAGTRVQQRVTVSVRPARTSSSPPVVSYGSEKPVTGPTAVQVTIGDGKTVRRIPELGLGMAVHVPEPLAGRTAELVSRLRPDALRVDLRLGGDAWRDRLDRAVAAASRIDGARMELAVFLSDEGGETELSGLSEWLATHAGERPIGRILVLPEWEAPRVVPDYDRLLAAAQSVLPAGIGARIAVGTNSDFVFINRAGPVPESADDAVFAINPQMHASDDGHLVETLPIQGMVALGARRLITARQGVVVSPVTLMPRWNPYAVTPGDPNAPPPVDPRQQSLFAAGWTVGSLKYLGENGADAVTYYETHGDNGIMSMDGDRVFPIWFVLHAVYGDPWSWRGIVPSSSSDPRAVECMALVDASGRHWRALIANLTRTTQSVRGVSGSVRLLDDANADSAMLDPDSFWTQPPTTVQSEGWTLPPHGIAIVDWINPEPASGAQSDEWM